MRTRSHLSLKKAAHAFAAHHGGMLSFEALRFNGMRAVLLFDNYPLYKAASEAARHCKACFTEHFCHFSEEFEGYVYLYNADEYQKIQNQLESERERTERWWQRYHAADDATKRKMSCGEIQ